MVDELRFESFQIKADEVKRKAIPGREKSMCKSMPHAQGNASSCKEQIHQDQLDRAECSVRSPEPCPRPSSHTERPCALGWRGYFPLVRGHGLAHPKALGGPNTAGGHLCDRPQVSALVPVDSPSPVPNRVPLGHMGPAPLTCR